MRNAWIFIGLMAALAQAAAGAPPPVEAFGRVPQVDNIALSPDGKFVAWDDNSGTQPIVVVFDLEARKQKGRFPIADSKLRRLQWSDASTLLVDLSMTQTVRLNRKHTAEWFRTLAVDVSTGESRVLLMDDESSELVTGATLLAARTSRPHTVMMAKWTFDVTEHRSAAGTRLAGRRQDSGWVYSVFSVDTRTGRGSAVETGSQFTNDWVVDAGGAPVARSEWEPSKRRYSILAKDGMGWRNIHTQENVEKLTTVRVSADGRAVLAIGPGGHKTSKLWSIPLDGSGARVLSEDPARDVIAVLVDSFTAAPIAVEFEGISPQRRWLDSRTEARHKALTRAFPERDVWIVDRSENYQRMLVRVQGPSNPPIYYLVDFATGRADIVGEAYPALSEAKLGSVRALSYRARDGASIPAYLTLPAGAEEKNLPLVVLPHGGPVARDYLKFDWWAQFLASRGYAVLQPQFRGSTGFGREHRKAGYRQWGGLMQDDVTDGVKGLIEQGLADARRVCIVGASYGGYAALAGAAFTPELYACSVSVNGVSDLPMMLNHIETRGGDESDAIYAWREHIGIKSDPKIAQKSPARTAAAIKAPVLLVHGVDDVVVPIAQSQKMYDALTKLGRPVKFVKLVGEDHWLSRSETRVRMLTELESFLDAHLAAPAAASAAPTEANR
ncbi:MAG: alpha/beta fold hydrolase [Gammaproteobacteria bacterium]